MVEDYSGDFPASGLDLLTFGSDDTIKTRVMAELARPDEAGIELLLLHVHKPVMLEQLLPRRCESEDVEWLGLACYDEATADD